MNGVSVPVSSSYQNSQKRSEYCTSKPTHLIQSSEMFGKLLDNQAIW